MVLRTKNFNILGIHWKIWLTFRGDLEKPIYRGRLPKEGGGELGQFADLKWGLARKRGWCFWRGGVDNPMSTMIILSHLELSRIDLLKLNSSFLIEIVTIPVGQVDEFYLYMLYRIKAWLFEKIIFELVYLFHIVLKSLLSH